MTILLFQMIIPIIFYNYTLAANLEDQWDISVDSNKGIIANLQENGKLVITGSGTMKDWSKPEDVPWYNKREKISSVIIGSEIINIGNYAFCGTRISVVDIPEPIATIGEKAFYQCYSMRVIKIPKTTSVIGEGAFWECYNLASIQVDEQNRSYVTQSNVLYDKLCLQLICYPSQNKMTQYTLPPTVEIIKARAFEGNNYLERIDFSQSHLVTIESKAFLNCIKLETMEIPQGVENVSEDCFKGCRGIKSLYISNNRFIIDFSLFFTMENLEYIEVSKENENYVTEDGVLYSKNKTRIIKYLNKEEEEFIVPDTVTSIGNYAFYHANRLKKLNYGLCQVTQIESNTFNNCSDLEEVILSDNITKIDKNAFVNCKNLRGIDISSNVDSIDRESFKNCDSLYYLGVDENNTIYSFKDGMLLNKEGTKLIQYFCQPDRMGVSIPEGIEIIGTKAFANLDKLSWIGIPQTVTKIEDEAFINCTNLWEIENLERVANIGNNILKDSCIFTQETQSDLLTQAMQEDSPLYSKMGFTTNLCTYSKVDKTIWYDQETLEKQGSATIKVNGGKLAGLTFYIQPKKLDVSKKLDGSIYATIDRDSDYQTLHIEGTGEMRQWQEEKSFLWHGFVVKDSIQSVMISDGVTTISKAAFKDCQNLVTLCFNGTTIGKSAFENCSNLTELGIYENLETIEEKAFKGCTKLRNIQVGSNNSKYVVKDGMLLKRNELELDLVLFTYGQYQYDDQEVHEITIPEGVTKIKNNAFSQEEIPIVLRIPDSIKQIEPMAIESPNTYLTLECNKNSEAEKYAKQKGIKYSTPSRLEGISITIDEGKQPVKAKEHKAKITVFENCDGNFIAEDGYKYVWKQTDLEEPEEAEFVNAFINQEEFGQDSLHGTWYLWVMAKDEQGGKETEVSQAVEFDNLVDLEENPITYQSNGSGQSKRITAIIHAKEEIQPVEGWQLEQDKRTLSKEYSKNTTEDVTIKDLLENETKVTVKIDSMIQKGDPNHDGKIDSTDLIILLRHIAASNHEENAQKNPTWILTGDELNSIDIKEDGIIDSTDTIKLLRHIAASQNEQTAQKYPDWILNTKKT